MSSDPQESNWDKKLSAIIGVVLSLLFIAGGFWVRRIQIHESKTLRETQGTVVDTASRRERNSTEEKTTYAPVIEFTANGKQTRFTGHYESYRLSNGRTVVVRYNADQPETSARVVDPMEGLTSWGMFIMGGLGVVFSLGDLLPVRMRLPGKRS